MGDSTPNIQVGNKVLFVGGPEAGNVRVIPESHGEFIKAEAEYVYRIWPIRMKGHQEAMYLAFAADQHPIQMFLEMWREYAPAAQIRRNAKEATTYQRVGGDGRV